MILLMVMSLLAITSLRASIQEERMSSTALDRNLAFQAAEAGLREGEKAAQKWAQNLSGTDEPPTPKFPISLAVEAIDALTPPGATPLATPASCTGLSALETAKDSDNPGLYKYPNPNCTTERWKSTDDLWQPIAGSTFETDVLSLKPKYMVELISREAPCDDSITPKLECYRFRVTATSKTDNGRANVVLQSIYATDGNPSETP
ncbi:hypothetical protein FACS1894116_03960 [Betaproteobacteria bacterium]|nr:hypothetical protein FACS1894116_03960 [Betaproteobacteria bacterium]GHU22546.1 hypothetical protein FACS189488_03310 [Betaproteobacteria bacterium]